MSLKIPSWQRLVSQHSQTAIFTSLLQSFYFQCIGLVASNHILYSCCIHMSPWSAGMTNLIILVVADISKFSTPLSDMLHCHNAITLHLDQLAVNFDGEICFTRTNQILLWTSVQDEVSNVIASAHQLLFWIESHCCAICWMLPY
jgi:hypothetical protein